MQRIEHCNGDRGPGADGGSLPPPNAQTVQRVGRAPVDNFHAYMNTRSHSPVVSGNDVPHLPDAPKDVTRAVFLRGLPKAVEHVPMDVVFTRFGRLAGSRIYHNTPGRTNDAWLEFVDEGRAELAIAELNGTNIGGERLSVTRYEPRSSVGVAGVAASVQSVGSASRAVSGSETAVAPRTCGRVCVSIYLYQRVTAVHQQSTSSFPSLPQRRRLTSVACSSSTGPSGMWSCTPTGGPAPTSGVARSHSSRQRQGRGHTRSWTGARLPSARSWCVRSR